ncbi:methylisocitrate lyase [Curvularia clavata]|uniref:Methylisocitrate lyase n=1 Tax=Curvularia clavata TaxID=95742 RepID=A0A9Q9DPB8_CURCL|nr:methylisocitrate lyase [Curvularia clavata]
MEHTAAPTGHNNAEKTSGRRKACNECKQQKLRCDLASEEATALATCGRCARLGLECKIDHDFRRKRKRRRSADLEKEVRELREQLESGRNASGASGMRGWSIFSPTPPSASANEALSTHFAPLSVTQPVSIPTDGSSVKSAEGIIGPGTHVPGLTTRPSIEVPTPRGSIWSAEARPRALGNTVLSVDEIDHLYHIFTTVYHPFLPLINTTKSPHEHFESSELLFWTIISVASRREVSQPTLLPKLARTVTDLTWRTLRSIPHNLSTVQALALLCTWPFPTSSSTQDPTFMFVGLMLQIATQMGLHRARDVQDFTKRPTTLDASEYAEWVHTWASCNLVAQSVSFGCGLPLLIPTHDWAPAEYEKRKDMGSLNSGFSFRSRLRIEHFRHRVSSYLSPPMLPISHTAAMQERTTIYRLLNAEFAEIERDEKDAAAFTNWHLAAAKLHLHAFYLFDDDTTRDYHDRIIRLYLTASSLIKLSLDYDINDGGFLHHCPFSCCQVFVCAAFVVLKILMNSFFRTMLDVDSGTQTLEAAIAALRKMSVVNNDLPARLGDVVSYFCAVPDPTVVGGATSGDLRLRQVQHRMSMSVVYDCLWTWRKNLQSEHNEATDSNHVGTRDESCSYSPDTHELDITSILTDFVDMDMLF